MLDWILAHDTILWWLAAASVVTFVATLILVPWLMVRIPSDYFEHRKRHGPLFADRHPLVRAMLLIGKNALACIFIVVGVVMLVIPGQGILTILAGIMLLNFPGKFRFQRWLVTRRPVLKSINWLRRRSARPPLVLDPNPPLP